MTLFPQRVTDLTARPARAFLYPLTFWYKLKCLKIIMFPVSTTLSVILVVTKRKPVKLVSGGMGLLFVMLVGNLDNLKIL